MKKVTIILIVFWKDYGIGSPVRLYDIDMLNYFVLERNSLIPFLVVCEICQTDIGLAMKA